MGKIKAPDVQEREHAERIRRQVEHWWPRWQEDLTDSANRAREWRRSFIMMPWLRNRFLSRLDDKLEFDRLKADLDIGYPCDEAAAVMAERFAEELRGAGWRHARVGHRERVFGGWERVIELSAAPNASERSNYFWLAAAGVVAGIVITALCS